jgi:hypothetical protein
MQCSSWLTCVAIIGCAVETHADPAAKPAAPPQRKGPMPAAPEMAKLAYFDGVWTCDVDAIATGHIPARKYVSTITIKDDLDGSWNAIRNESAGVTIAGYSGWDRTAKHYVRVAFDSFGGMETKISDGWKDKDWVWTGTSSVTGKDAPLRHTITKQGDGEFLGKYEIQDGSAWTQIRTEHCKKSP